MGDRAKLPLIAASVVVEEIWNLLATRTVRRICGITADRSLRNLTRCFIEPLELRRLLDALPSWAAAA
jgi:hypothetical protein